MKTRTWLFQAAALPLLIPLLSCSGGDGKPTPSVVTLQGVGTSGVSSMTVGLSDVTVTIDGKAAFIGGISGVVDIASKGELSVARFAVPDGARTVSVTLLFDDYATYASTSGRTGIVDAHGKSVSLSIPASALVNGGIVGISLDVGRSLAPSGGGWVLEPHVSVSY